MLHIGIDEAGYGPLLGPLVVAGVSWRTPNGAGDLARALARRVIRRPRRVAGALDAGRPVVVDDSKVVHGRLGRAGLVRGVHALVEALGHAPPRSLADALACYGVFGASDLAPPRWAAGLEGVPFPEAPPARLRQHVSKHGVSAAGLALRPMGAGELNRTIDRLGNKARALALATGEVLLRLLDTTDDAEAEIVLDRQGGRLDYAEWLSGLFPFASVDPRPAPKGDARYVLVLPGRRFDVRVLTSGDARALLVGWASMAAKLVRELYMDRLNAWFSERLPDLAPTAGYRGDGGRFLDDVRPLLAAEGIDEWELVRAR